MKPEESWTRVMFGRRLRFVMVVCVACGCMASVARRLEREVWNKKKGATFFWSQ